MIEFSVGRIPIRMGFWFPVMILVMLWWGDEAFTLQCLAASFLHECGHFAMMLSVHDVPERICFGVFGVRVERRQENFTGYAAQAAVSFAGPFANLFCALLLYALHGGGNGVWVHLALGLFNLLPIEGLDGGEGAYRLCCLFLREDRARWIVRWSSAAVLLPLTALGFTLLLASGGNISLVILSFYLIFLLIFKEKH